MSIEEIINRNADLLSEINLLGIRLCDARRDRGTVLGYCASSPELYGEFCDYLAARFRIPPQAVFNVQYTKGSRRPALKEYLLHNISDMENIPGDVAFVKARGFADLAATEIQDDNQLWMRYMLSRCGHDYDQMAIESFHRELGRQQSKAIFVLTHLDKSHEFFEKAYCTAVGSQFRSCPIFEIE